jgi:hypothetical protein
MQFLWLVSTPSYMCLAPFPRVCISYFWSSYFWSSVISWYLVDRWGRRAILLSGAVVVSIPFWFPNSVQVLIPYRWASPWLPQAGGCTLTFHKLPKLSLFASLSLMLPLAIVGVPYRGCTLPKSVPGFSFFFYATDNIADYASCCSCQGRFTINCHKLGIQLSCWGDDPISSRPHWMAAVPNARVLLCLQFRVG